MTERNKAVPAVYLILKRDDSILLARRYNTGYYDGWYSLPAGHVEYKELPTQALIRECEEEIGIKLAVDELALSHLSCREAYDETEDRVDMYFIADTGHKHEPVNQEPEKCDQLYWCLLDDLPKNMVQNVRQAVEKSCAGVLYSELDWTRADEQMKEYQSSLTPED